MWAECCDDGGLKFTDNTKELTYEEALEGLEDIALYRKGRLSIFEKIFFKKLKEAIEKAKKYDELNKQ